MRSKGNGKERASPYCAEKFSKIGDFAELAGLAIAEIRDCPCPNFEERLGASVQVQAIH
jgi:hypothetical protein